MSFMTIIVDMKSEMLKIFNDPAEMYEWLESDENVNEFCRLPPAPDRDAKRKLDGEIETGKEDIQDSKRKRHGGKSGKGESRRRHKP